MRRWMIENEYPDRGLTTELTCAATLQYRLNLTLRAFQGQRNFDKHYSLVASSAVTGYTQNDDVLQSGSLLSSSVISTTPSWRLICHQYPIRCSCHVQRVLIRRLEGTNRRKIALFGNFGPLGELRLSTRQ